MGPSSRLPRRSPRSINRAVRVVARCAGLTLASWRKIAARQFPPWPTSEGDKVMPTAQVGDRVLVHYVVCAQDGSRRSSRGLAPLELTVGVDHPRLPGLGLALVGLAPGQGATVTVPPERAYGLPNPVRIRRWRRGHFPKNAALQPGSLVRVTDRSGRQRMVRALEVGTKVVVIDTNHRWAGQTLRMEVELVAIESSGRFPTETSTTSSEEPT